MEKPQILVYVEKSLNYSAFDVKWIPRSAKVVAIGSHPQGTGALQVYEMTEGDLKLLHDVERPKALKCGTFGASTLEDRHLAIGDFEGKMEIIDLQSPQLPVYSVKAHNEIVNAIDGIAGLNIGKGAPEIATGSRDGLVKVWDPRQKDRSVITIEPKDGEQRRDCWSVAFGNSHSNDDRVLCAGFDNGDVKMFDLRSMAVKWETNLKNGVCSLEFDRKDILMNKLLTTTLESKFFVYDLRTFHEEKGFAKQVNKGHKSTVWCGRHLPQNREIFVTTGGNGSVMLWKYSYPDSRSKKLDDGSEIGVVGESKPLQNATLTDQPITSFDWSPDKMGLSVCSGLDQAIRIVIVTKLNTV
ncbi:dynein axonemal assembly factor 10-like isoform X1 [Homarus americanus]|uniref:dynein axonemal assembly factor 10-like isoform X1 n=2 Tax=Homarus americanus TaxID=6706 RepID=UPI001C44695E|nr:dynein axonemal assembly factor 10-like isoform X1 [Homarus americanus]